MLLQLVKRLQEAEKSGTGLSSTDVLRYGINETNAGVGAFRPYGGDVMNMPYWADRGRRLELEMEDKYSWTPFRPPNSFFYCMELGQWYGI